MEIVFILKDYSVEDFVNPFNAFSYELNKWFRYGKIIQPDYEFNDSDIVVINLHKNTNIGNYKIQQKSKIITIVHEIDKNSINILEKSSHVIFMNKYQESYSKIFLNFQGRYTTLPRFPLKDIKVFFKKENVVYIGGLLTYNKISNLHNKIEELNIKLPRDIKYICDFAIKDESISKHLKDFSDKINSIDFLSKKVFINVRNNQSYEKMLFNILCSRYAYIWDDGHNFTDFESRLESKDENIYNSSISDSAMLAHLESAKCDIFLEDKIKFQAYFNKPEIFTYKDFAKKLEHIITEII